MTRPGTEKEIELSGKTFKIRKFTPQLACFWAAKLFGAIAGKAGGKIKTNELPALIEQFTQMPFDEFETFQKNCLSFVSQRFEAGWFPVMTEEGYPSDPDMTAPNLLVLTVHSFMFSMTDFLDPALLGNLPGAQVEVPILKEKTGSKTSSSTP